MPDDPDHQLHRWPGSDDRDGRLPTRDAPQRRNDRFVPQDVQPIRLSAAQKATDDR